MKWRFYRGGNGFKDKNESYLNLTKTGKIYFADGKMRKDVCFFGRNRLKRNGNIYSVYGIKITCPLTAKFRSGPPFFLN